MAQPFRDIAQNLRTKPAIQWPGGNDIDRLYIVQDTVPVANFPEFPTIVEDKTVSAITPANGATPVANGTYVFGITGSWGNAFNVVVGSSNPGTNYIALPSGVTQSTVITAIMARMMMEWSVQPAVAANGGLAIWKTDGTTALTSVPSPFTLAATTASFLKTNLPDKFRRGSPHPRCQWLKLCNIEVLGKDDHNWNISIFYKVDRAKLCDAIGVDDDSIVSSFAGYEITEPYDSPSYPTVTWTFEILNPELHVRVPNKTPHPWVPQARLVNEKRFEQNGVHLVTRVYMTLPGPVLETPSSDGTRLAKVMTRTVWTDASGYAPGDSFYLTLSEKLVPDREHPAVSQWQVECEQFPGPVIINKDTKGTATSYTVTRRVSTANASAGKPSAPSGSTEIEAELRPTDNDKVSVWELKSEVFPGPVIRDKGTRGTGKTYVLSRRVLTASADVGKPAAPEGSAELRATLKGTDNELVSEWQVECEELPSPVQSRKKRSGKSSAGQTIYILTRRVSVATADTDKPSVPEGCIEVDADLQPTDNDLIAEWRVEYEALPGPTITGKKRDGADGALEFDVTRRVAAAAADSNIPAAPEGATVIRQELRATDNDAVSVWVLTCRELPGDSLAGLDFDEETGYRVPSVTQIIAASAIPSDTSPVAAMDVNGDVVEFHRIDKVTARKTTRRMLIDGHTRSYWTTRSYHWPAVLKDLAITPISMRNGGTAYRVDLDFKNAVTRECSAKVEETWSVAKPTPESPSVMVPTSFEFRGFRLSFSIPACLHVAISETETIGTSDPDFSADTYTKALEATNYTDWPESIVSDCNVVPFRGGWKMTKITVYRPGYVIPHEPVGGGGLGEGGGWAP